MTDRRRLTAEATADFLYSKGVADGATVVDQLLCRTEKLEGAMREILKHDGSKMSLCGDQTCHAVVLGIAREALSDEDKRGS